MDGFWPSFCGHCWTGTTCRTGLGRAVRLFTGDIWILIGATLGGGVHDMVVLFASVRRRGKTLGANGKGEIGVGVGTRSRLISVSAIMIILIAVLALVVVQALANSPWGVSTIAMTIPMAFDHGYRVAERKSERDGDDHFRLGGLGLGVWGGQFLAQLSGD